MRGAQRIVRHHSYRPWGCCHLPPSLPPSVPHSLPHSLPPSLSLKLPRARGRKNDGACRVYPPQQRRITDIKRPDICTDTRKLLLMHTTSMFGTIHIYTALRVVGGSAHYARSQGRMERNRQMVQKLRCKHRRLANATSSML